MSLTDSLNAAQPYRRGPVCGMRGVFAVLSAKDRDALVKALMVGKGEPGRLSNQQISDILRSEGHEVSMQVIETHRKLACSCDSVG